MKQHDIFAGLTKLGDSDLPNPPWINVLKRYTSCLSAKDDSLWPLQQLLDPTSLRSRMPRINPDYASFFGPQDLRGSPYPLNQLGSFARVDRSYLAHWVDLKALHAALLASTPTHQTVSFNAIIEAVGTIGALTYSSEWVNDAETREDLENGASAISVLQVNELMGREAVGLLSVLNLKIPHILDIGVGRGNTLLPVLLGLRKTGWEKIRISLMDVSREQLEKTVERIYQEVGVIGVQVDFVELIEANLHELTVSVAVRTSEFDLIISGGTFFHSTDKQRIFDWTYSSLRPQGFLLLWDWFAPCWAAPTLKIGDKGHHEVSGVYVASREQAIAAVQTWGIGWFGPRGYFNYGTAGFGGLTDALRNELTQYQAGQPLNFVDWLSRVATRYPPPLRLAHYYCIEGYTNPDIYRAHIKKSGFRTCDIFSQAEIRARHGLVSDGRTGDGYDNTVKIFVLQRTDVS